MCVWTHSRGVKSACLCIKTTAWYVATIGWRPETESQEKGYVLSDKNTQRERESERNTRVFFKLNEGHTWKCKQIRSP